MLSNHDDLADSELAVLGQKVFDLGYLLLFTDTPNGFRAEAGWFPRVSVDGRHLEVHSADEFLTADGKTKKEAATTLLGLLQSRR